MSSPKIICKTAYTKNIEHVFNLLEYAGNAIASQAVIFKDGSVQTVSADKKIYFSEAEISMVDKINIGFKDGGSKNISYETYRKIVEKTQTVVTVDDLVPVTGNFSPAELDFMNITGEKPYRELIDMDIFKYLNYFSQREGVVKSVDGHGLFGVTGDISITDAKELAAKHIESRKWLHILSLPEGEDVRTGFDKREMWQALISAEAPRIAKLYNISLENLVINAGLHTNTENTHNHLVLYSKDPKEGYIKGDTKAMIRVSERFKSIFVNKIFKDDISSLNTSKALVRDELKTSLDQHLKNIKQNPSFSKEISDKFLELADVIKNDPDLKENSSYGYMKSKDKVLVDDLLHTMIMSDPDMKNLFEKYMEIETEYIKNYNSDSDKIAKRLENLEGCFFAPNSNKNKSYHNVIYRAVQEFNKLEMPPQFVRTVEREISDFSPIDDTLSSLLGSEPPPDTFSSFSSEYLEANLVRTVEGKISNFSSTPYSLSSTSKEISEYLNDKPDCINFKSFSNIYRKSINGIFNPKILHTDLQVQLVDKLLELNSELSNKGKEKLSPEKISKINEIFDLINAIDPKFKYCIDILVDNTFDTLTEKFSDDDTNKYINSFLNSLDSQSELGTCKYYINYLAQNIYDQKYYQLLQAYKEYNTPINKALYKVINDIDMSALRSDDRKLLDMLKHIKTLSDDIEGLGYNDLYVDKVRDAFSQFRKDTNFEYVVSDFIAKYSDIFNSHFCAENADYYLKRLHKNLLSPQRLMRPHYSVINFANSIDNIIVHKIVNQYKEPLTKILTRNITECLCDEKEVFSSQLIMQKLKSIRDFDKPESAAEIIKYIYNTDLSFKKEVDNHIEHCYTAFNEEFGTEKAQELIEDYKNSFFSSDSDIKNPLHQTVKYLAKVQFERTYQKIIKEHRELFEPMGVLIKDALLNALKPHNSSMKINSLLDELGIKIEELDKLRKIEKPDETIKEVIKENLKLQTKLRSQILKQFDINTIDKAINECTPTFDELFQKYCDPNDALAMSERLKSDIYAGEANISSNYTMQFYAENANSIRQNGINYRNALVVKSVGQIMKLIATSLHTHANYLHQENERKNKLESALRSKKQFKTKKFDRGGFATDKENQISY